MLAPFGPRPPRTAGRCMPAGTTLSTPMAYTHTVGLSFFHIYIFCTFIPRGPGQTSAQLQAITVYAITMWAITVYTITMWAITVQAVNKKAITV